MLSIMLTNINYISDQLLKLQLGIYGEKIENGRYQFWCNLFSIVIKGSVGQIFIRDIYSDYSHILRLLSNQWITTILSFGEKLENKTIMLNYNIDAGGFILKTEPGLSLIFNELFIFSYNIHMTKCRMYVNIINTNADERNRYLQYLKDNHVFLFNRNYAEHNIHECNYISFIPTTQNILYKTVLFLNKLNIKPDIVI